MKKLMTKMGCILRPDQDLGDIVKKLVDLSIAPGGEVVSSKFEGEVIRVCAPPADVNSKPQSSPAVLRRNLIRSLIPAAKNHQL